MSGRRALVVLLLFVASCKDPPARPVERRPIAGPAIDLREVMHRVHFAFRREPGGLRGGDGAYTTLVDERGVLEVSARAGEVASTLRLDTEWIGRSSPASRAAEPRLDERAEIDIDHGTAVEHLRNTRDGVEQSWRFVEAPPGAGDLRVRLAVAGAPFAGRTAGGLHFMEPGRIGFRYGRATWIDRSGARTELELLSSPGAIEIRVPAEVVDGSSFPAQIDPVVSPEIVIDQPYTPAPADQGQQAVASDGTDFAVAWLDERNQNGPFFTIDVYAARLNAAGVVLDPAGVRLSSTGGGGAPAIDWDGRSYLVAWRNGGNVVGVRMSRTGTVGPLFRVIQGRSTASPPSRPAIASGDGRSLIIWADVRNGTSGVDLYGARITAGGTVPLDRGDLPISTSLGGHTDPAVTWDGAGWAVAWTDRRNFATSGLDIYGVRVGADGVPILPEVALSTAAGDQRQPALASDGQATLVVWADRRDPANGFDLYGARLGRAGTLLASAQALVSSIGDEFDPSLTWTGAGYFLAWDAPGASGRDVLGSRLDSNGAVLDVPNLTISATTSNQALPAVASSTSVVLAAWTDGRNFNTSHDDIYAARIGFDGRLLDPAGVLVSKAREPEFWPRVASDGTNYLVTWTDLRAGDSNYDVYGTRISPAGAVLDPAGIPISTANWNQLLASVASNGRGFLVAWTDYRSSGNPSDTIPPPPADVYAARVTSQGVVLDPTGIPIAAGPDDENTPALTSDGSDYFVVYQVGYYDSDLYGRRIRGDGTLLDLGPIAVSTAAGSQRLASVGWDGTNYVAAWSDNRSSGVVWQGFDIFATRVSTAGVVLDPEGIPTSTASGEQIWPAVAGGGPSTLITWSDGRSSTTGATMIYGARLSPAGQVLDPGGIAFSGPPAGRDAPAAAWTGAAYLAVWGEYGDAVGCYVGNDGRPIPGSGFAVSVTGQDGNCSVAVQGGVGLVAYQTTSLPEIAVRFVAPAFGPGLTCHLDSDCASDHCADGVCCDQACDGQCEACTAAQKGSGVDGVCGAAADGTDPRGACTGGGAACLLAACQGGVCQVSVQAGVCFVNGSCFSAGSRDPTNACQICAPGTSSTAFSPAVDGTPCPAGRCLAGACGPNPDAGAPDAVGGDGASGLDSGQGVIDAGPPEGGAPDAPEGAPDAAANTTADAAPAALDANAAPADGGGSASDAAPADGSGGDGSASKIGSAKGCGCSAAVPELGGSDRSPAAPALLFLVGVAATAVRRRRRVGSSRA
jgi:hypothetical protein